MAKLGGVKIMVVEDGSDVEEVSRMTAIVEEQRDQYDCLLPLKVLPRNHGKGAAVYLGWSDAGNADWLGFVDADGSCSALEVARLIQLLRSETSTQSSKSVFFASRVKMLGRNVDRLFKRHLLGRIFATLVSELLDVPVYDSQCGLKLVPRAAYETIADRLRIKGFAFDVELMVALLDTGCYIQEIPIDWFEVSGGKINLLRDSWRMASDVIKIRAGRNV
jgi:dolichyl-phosphate beta-glucosyltransferase